MTDVQNDEKPKKLTFGNTGKLSLNRSSVASSANVTKSFSGKSGIVVEVRKSRNSAADRLNIHQEFSEESGLDKRRDILKKADESKSVEKNVKYTTLSELAEMNKNKLALAEELSHKEEAGQEQAKRSEPVEFKAKDFEKDEEEFKSKIADLKNPPAKIKVEEPRKL